MKSFICIFFFFCVIHEAAAQESALTIITNSAPDTNTVFVVFTNKTDAVNGLVEINKAMGFPSPGRNAATGKIESNKCWVVTWDILKEVEESKDKVYVIVPPSTNALKNVKNYVERKVKPKTGEAIDYIRMKT